VLAYPSTEVNFALPRQFSIPVSSFMTLVVFGDLISNKSLNRNGPSKEARSYIPAQGTERTKMLLALRKLQAPSKD
jgi:hypothetical protein